VSGHYVKVADIAYLGNAADTDYARSQCKLDIYYPKDVENYPSIVWFHGGGLRGGKRQTGKSFAERFTVEGIAVILVGYRFSPKVKCPVYIEDAAASVAWTINNIAKYKGDPKKVFLSGHSAGGYLTAMVGVDPSYLKKHNISTNQIAGLMPVSGQMITHSTVRGERDIPSTQPVIDRFAPAFHASKTIPPFLGIMGDKDLPARLEENTYMAAVLKAAGHKSSSCQIFRDRNHSSIAGRFKSKDDEVASAMLKFMKQVLDARESK
jgi:acetyl esterase/lipase